VLAHRLRPIRRRITAPVVTVAVVMVLAAGLITQFATAASERATSSGVLVVDNVFNNHLMDPQRENSSSANIALHAMYDTLVTFHGTDYSKVLPDAATSWTVSPDGRSIAFHLRHGIVFSTGNPLTSKDVAFSFARLVNLKVPQSPLLNGVTLRTAGKYTVIITSDTPNPALLRIMGTPALSIVDRKTLAQHGGTAALNASTADTAESWVSSNSVGSGPYMMQQITPGQEIDLVANPKYWGPKPRFGKVVLRNMPAAAELLNVQRGVREIAVDVSPIDAATLSGNKSVQVVSGPGTKMFYLTVNEKPGVTAAANPLLMQAIRYGLDYNAIMALGGPQSQRLAGMVPYGLLGALPPSKAIQQDLPKAKALIAQYGGPPPSFDVSYVLDFSFAGINEQTVAEKVQSSLNALGFNVNLIGRPLGTHLAVRAAGGLQVNIGLQSMNYPDPNNYLDYCPGGPQAVFVAYTDPVTLKICNLARATMDDKKRAAYMIEYQDRLNASCPYMPIMQPPAILVGSAQLTGVVPNGVWNIDVAKVGEKKT
jgi:peptide/nickel transport system substrate-binding protein